MAARKSFEPEPVRTGVGIGAEHLQPCGSGDFDEGSSQPHNEMRPQRRGAGKRRWHRRCRLPPCARSQRRRSPRAAGCRADRRRCRGGRRRRDRAVDRLAAGAARAFGRGVRSRRRRRRGEPCRDRHARRGRRARAGRSTSLLALALESQRMWPDFGRALEAQSGLGIDFRDERYAGGGARSR